MLTRTVALSSERRFVITRRTGQGASNVLVNLMRDTSPPMLAFLAEQYGLRRIPGLSKDALITRILRHLSLDKLAALEADLIAGRYGSLEVGELVELAIQEASKSGRPGPRLDQVSAQEAFLIERGTRRWVFTMRGHDVIIDAPNRTLACDCAYFEFSARRQAICKHLALGFRLIPEVYARDALVEVLATRQYGDHSTKHWDFVSIRKVAMGA